MLQINIVRALLSYLRRRSTPIPIQPQPIDLLDQYEVPLEHRMRVWLDQRRARHGPMPEYRYILSKPGQPDIGVYREMQYIGPNASNFVVRKDQMLSFEATVAHPELGRFELTGTFRKGVNWTPEGQKRYLASSLARQVPGIEKPSRYIENATIAIDWYTRSYTAIPVGNVVG